MKLNQKSNKFCDWLKYKTNLINTTILVLVLMIGILRFSNNVGAEILFEDNFDRYDDYLYWNYFYC